MVLDLYDLWSLGDGVMLCIGEVFRESNEIMFEPLNLLWLSSMREMCLEVTWLVEHCVHSGELSKESMSRSSMIGLKKLMFALDIFWT
jgi:hypothetical protein